MFIHWRSLFRRARFEKDMDSEFAFHVEARARDLMRCGVSSEEAKRQARLEFGASQRYSDECREAHRLNWFDELARNIKFSVRLMRKSPVFSIAAILSLALGIGVNTLVFSVLNSLLLRPLPIREPKQVVFLETESGPSYSFPDYKEFRDRNSTFSGMSGYRISPMSLQESGNTVRVWGYLATGNYFDVLGVKPTLGRFFHSPDDLNVGASPYAVISYSSWQVRFGGNPSIVGRDVRINGLSYTVLGVAPPGFHGTELFYWPELWVPMTMEPQIEVGNPWLDNRYTWNTWIFGRLKPGVTAGAATSDLTRIANQLARAYPGVDKGLTVRLSQPGLIGSMLRGPVKAFSGGVLILAILVLLTACSNLGALTLARAASRQKEIAIRLSIGAGRGRLIFQSLTDSMLLAAAGGGAGCLLALVLSRLPSEWRAPLDFPVQLDVQPDWVVFVFALSVSAFVGLLFGIGPALKLSRGNASDALKGGTSVDIESHKLGFRDVLLVAEVALCFVLVFSSILAARGLQHALVMPIGMDVQNVATIAFDLGSAGYTEMQGKAFQQRVLDEVRGMPGVISAAYASSLPLSIDQSTTRVSGSDQPPATGRRGIGANYYDVSAGLPATIGLELMAGRDFNANDDSHAPQVAIVNQTFARMVMHTESPVGKTFRHGFGGALVQVVGLVRDGKYQSLTESPQPALFWPITQRYSPTTTVVVRSALPSAEVVRELRRRITALDPRLALYGTGSLSTMLGFALFPMHAAAIALSTFGILAIVLAITGIHGLAAYAVAQRTRELGIRIALGAGPSRIIHAVLRQLVLVVGAGILIGSVLTFSAGPVLRSVIYGVSPHDSWIFFIAIAGLALVAALSCWSPVVRALRTDPALTLRYE
jgi:predicted permease